MKRVLIVDDHPVMRYGLGQLIAAEEDMEVCGEAGKVSEGLEAVGKLKPDLAIIDISLPDKSGMSVLRQALGDLSKLAGPDKANCVCERVDHSIQLFRSVRGDRTRVDLEQLRVPAARSE